MIYSKEGGGLGGIKLVPVTCLFTRRVDIFDASDAFVSHQQHTVVGALSSQLSLLSSGCPKKPQKKQYSLGGFSLVKMFARPV